MSLTRIASHNEVRNIGLEGLAKMIEAVIGVPAMGGNDPKQWTNDHLLREKDGIEHNVTTVLHAKDRMSPHCLEVLFTIIPLCELDKV